MTAEIKTLKIICAECQKSFIVRFPVIDEAAEGRADGSRGLPVLPKTGQNTAGEKIHETGRTDPQPEGRPMNNREDLYDLVVEPKIEEESLTKLEKLAGRLDRLLEESRAYILPQAGLLEQIGRMLWEASGLDPQALLKKLDDARDDEEYLRVIIQGDNYYILPWELLFHEHPDIGFLSLHPRCVLTRRIKSKKTKQPSTEPKPLKNSTVHFLTGRSGPGTSPPGFRTGRRAVVHRPGRPLCPGRNRNRRGPGWISILPDRPVVPKQIPRRNHEHARHAGRK